MNAEIYISLCLTSKRFYLWLYNPNIMPSFNLEDKPAIDIIQVYGLSSIRFSESLNTIFFS